ncbi:DNA polymerase (family 10) [Desulfitispora alkaliphila]|uniref:DNA polymerase/3'-5' exonuclease PolX n=1 Tax=Desulfitispora alkaliphila TaxID=622674 RepID=UPI003D1957CD
MTNNEIMWKLTELRDLLILSGKKSSESESEEERIAAEEVEKTGNSSLIDQLRTKIPPGLIEMIEIPELDAITINKINRELGVTTLNGLRKVAKKRQLRRLEGISSKRELSILRSIKLLLEPPERFPSAIAKPMGDKIVADIMLIPGVINATLSGELRRGMEMVDFISIVIKGDNSEEILGVMSKHPLFKKNIFKSSLKLVVETNIKLKVEMEVAESSEYWHRVHHTTGSADYIEEFERIDKSRNITLGVDTINCEQDLYKKLDMQYVEPELRESKSVIELAIKGEIPELINMDDYKGDLHSHTMWSDGTGTVEEIARAAIKQQYSYLAITEHTKSLKIARGITEQELEQQMDEIDKLNSKFAEEGIPFRLLKGVEVDILKSGILDFENEVLEKMDLVIASVHTDFDQSKQKMTERIIKALENPYVNIFAHPTGRILGRRSGYEVDLDQVFAAAKETGTVLEINSAPDRLDLNYLDAKRARDMGIKIAINTDSHDPERLSNISFGIQEAKKGWLKAEDVINCMGLEELQEFFKAQKN